MTRPRPPRMVNRDVLFLPVRGVAGIQAKGTPPWGALGSAVRNSRRRVKVGWCQDLSKHRESDKARFHERSARACSLLGRHPRALGSRAQYRLQRHSQRTVWARAGWNAQAMPRVAGARTELGHRALRILAQGQGNGCGGLRTTCSSSLDASATSTGDRTRRHAAERRRRRDIATRHRDRIIEAYSTYGTHNCCCAAAAPDQQLVIASWCIFLYATRVALGVRIDTREVRLVRSPVSSHAPRRREIARVLSILRSTLAPAILTENASRSHPTRRPHSGDAPEPPDAAPRSAARASRRASRRARAASASPRAPASNTHTVASGESLWAISVARGVTLPELKAANAKALGRGDTIYPGQQLIVPPGGAPTVRLRAFRVQAQRGRRRGRWPPSAGNAGAPAPPSAANLAKERASVSSPPAAQPLFPPLAAEHLDVQGEEPPGRGAEPLGRTTSGTCRAVGWTQGGGLVFDQNDGYTNGQGGYCDQYNQSDWPQQPGNGFGDARASPARRGRGVEVTAAEHGAAVRERHDDF